MRRLGWGLRAFLGLAVGLAVPFTIEACGSAFDTASGDAADAAEGSPPDAFGAFDAVTTANDATSTPGPMDSALDGGASTDAAADDGGDGGTSGDDSGGCVDDCESAAYLAIAGGPVEFLAASSVYAVWIENGTTARNCTFDTLRYEDAGSSGVSVAGVSDLAVNADYAFIAEPAANNTNLIAYQFDGTVAATGDTNKPVNGVTTLGSMVFDVANGYLETNTEKLDAGKQLSSVAIMGNQIKGAGSWLYYTDDNNILYACSPGSTGCDIRYELFQGPQNFVYAVNENQNIFWFDQVGHVLGCTFDKMLPAPGYGCNAAQTIAAVSTPAAIVTVGDDVYWIDNGSSPPAVYSAYTPQSNNGSIGAPFGRHRRVAPADPHDTLGKLAVNSTYVIWSEQESATKSIIVRAGLSVP